MKMHRVVRTFASTSLCAIYFVSLRGLKAAGAPHTGIRGYSKHVIVVGGGRVGISIALALSRAANDLKNPAPKPFQVESLFSGSDSLNPTIRHLEEHKKKIESASLASTAREQTPHRTKITMLIRDPDIAESMQKTRLCAPYFPALQLPADIEISSRPEKVFWQFHAKGQGEQSNRKQTLYYPSDEKLYKVPIVAIFLCVPYSALDTIFQGNGLLHSFKQKLPWHSVFSDTPGLVCLTRGMDEKARLPYEIIRANLLPQKKEPDCSKSEGYRPIPFVVSQISGPFQPIELIDGKPTSLMVTAGPSHTEENLKIAIQHEMLVFKLLGRGSPSHPLYIHQFHTHHISLHHSQKSPSTETCQDSSLRACSILVAMKEFYSLLFGLLHTTWSGDQSAPGSCSGAAASLQVALINELGLLLDLIGLPSGSVYTIAGMGDIVAGCAASGGSSKDISMSPASPLMDEGLMKKLENACRRHICDWHPLYLMGTRIAQGFPGTYIFQLKGKASQSEKANSSKFQPSKFPYSPTPNAYAEYIVGGVEHLLQMAEKRLTVNPDETPSDEKTQPQIVFPVLRACVKALRYDRRAKELGNIVLHPNRQDIKYSEIDMVDIDNRDPNVYRHPMVDVMHILSENAVRPTEQTKANEEKLKLKMPTAPPAMQKLV